jgi:exonuclease III
VINFATLNKNGITSRTRMDILEGFLLQNTEILFLEEVIHSNLNSNSRSRVWHNKLTNRELEEFLITQELFIMNEESYMKMFQSSRGSSNTDLTISNYKLLKEVQECKISEEESCSDHKIIQFCIGKYNA